MLSCTMACKRCLLVAYRGLWDLLALKHAPNFPRIFWGFFVLCFLGKRRPQKINQNPRQQLRQRELSPRFESLAFVGGHLPPLKQRKWSSETLRSLCWSSNRAIGVHLFRTTREGWNCQFQKNTPRGRWGQGPGSVDLRFPANLPFPVPEILEFVAFRDSGIFFQLFSRDFPGAFLGNPREDPGNSHSLLELSDLCNIRSTRNCGMACESWQHSLNAGGWGLAILHI